MVNRKKKGKYIGMAGALVVHVAIIALLILVGFTPPEPSEEGGVPVMLGEVPDALGAADPSLVKVDVMPEETAPQVQETVEQDIITQETEETVAIKPKAEPKKKEEVKKPEKTEAEKAEEARKLAAAKAERERKEAEEAARKRVAGAFGKGAQMGSKGDTEGEGIQGSPTGNAPSGATSGTGGYGSFNLGGRSLGEGGLPRPVYNVQDEGRVVVTITVNPAGHVIATSINRQTNTVNPALRKAAEDAAKKARFNAVSGLNNQTGTITYYFNLNKRRNNYGYSLCFFADGFEEIEAFTSVDVMRRAGLNVEMVTVTPDEIVTGAHDVPVLCDKNVVNCDFFDAELVLLPGGMPGASTLEKCGELRNLVLRFAQEQKPIAAICAAPMVLGKLGLLKGKKATCYPGFEQYLEGAECTGAPVERDGNIITGKGPGAAMEFALAVVELLQGKEKVQELKEAMCVTDL